MPRIPKLYPRQRKQLERDLTGGVKRDRDPTSSDYRDPKTGEPYPLQDTWLNTSTNALWVLTNIASNSATWKLLSSSGGNVTELRDQVDAVVSPNSSGYIDIDGKAVANAGNPSAIPVETVAGTNKMDLQVQVATAIGSAPGDKNDAGICSFDSNSFSVDADGFVTLAGGSGPAVDQINVDANTAPGTDPVLADGSGEIAIAGAVVASHSTPVESHSRAANAFNIEVQVSSAITGAPADKTDSGLCSFDDNAFAVDSNGYVTLVGSSAPAIQTLTSDDPTAVGPDGSGNITVTGEAVANATNAKPLYIDAGTNALNAEVQVAAAITGAPGDKNDAGICSFNDTDFSVDADGYVSLAAGVDGSLIFLASATASASATVDFTSNIDSTYDQYIIIFSSVKPGTDDVDLRMRTSTDGGSNFDSGINDYKYSINMSRSDGGETTPRSTGSDHFIVAGTSGYTLGSAAGESCSGWVALHNPSAADITTFHVNTSQITPTGAVAGGDGPGSRDAAEDVNAVRFYMSSGNIASGEFRLYGVENS